MQNRNSTTLHSVVAGSISRGGDPGIHCWLYLIRLKQLFSSSVYRAQMFAGFSGHGKSIYNIIPQLKKENVYQLNSFLSLRVFGLLSSSLLLFPQRFGRYVLRPSSGVCRTRELSRNFELSPLLNPRVSPVLIPLAITGYKYSCIVTRLQSGFNLQPSDYCLLRSLGNQCL